MGREGKFFFEKHKIFLYKEDFDKFVNALHETVDHVRTNLLSNNGQGSEDLAATQSPQ